MSLFANFYVGNFLINLINVCLDWRDVNNEVTVDNDEKEIII
jgi:hypothetical protein